MPTLILMVGLPRSGKSTRARQLGHPIVCPDSIRLAVHGRPFLGAAEPWIWLVARTMVKSLFLSGHGTVILDACSHTRERRDEWESKDWKTVFEVVDTPIGECIARAVELGQPELVSVIQRMEREIEWPSPGPGWIPLTVDGFCS